MMFLSLVGLAVGTLPLVTSKCFELSPAFPVPLWTDGQKTLRPVFEVIESKLQALLEQEKFDTSSYSVELTSNAENLWSQFHTARVRDSFRPGVETVDGDSVYRIASITKTFTVLGILQQHAAGNLSLDDPISEYIPELSGPDSGEIPWKDITLRILASQLSGIPRESEQADLINILPNPLVVGLPPASKKGLPTCYEYSDSGRQCNRTDLLDTMKKKKPLFAPNQKSTYSNVAFELLGVVIENISGMSYSDYIQSAIFGPLGMANSSLEKPSDEHAVLPAGPNFWDADEGIHAPTGGIYATSSDMDIYVRYILTHYNTLATGVNWILPASWAEGAQSFFGMPFEIYRTNAILEDSRRAVTFVTKAGGVPGYFSEIILIPEYGLGVTILTAGDPALVGKIRDLVTVELVRAAEKLVWKSVDQRYTGHYIAIDHALNSSVDFVASSSGGLVMDKFISNGTNVFDFIAFLQAPTQDGPWRAQLQPTLLFANETAQQGEIWRIVIVPERDPESEATVWDDHCITNVDYLMYAGLPINEVIFWHEEGLVEFTAWKVIMKKTAIEEATRFVVQT